MLHNEYQVKYDGENRKDELCNVEPIAYLYASTREAKDSPQKIEYNIPNAPSFGAFSFVVIIHWRSVLHKTNHQLTIP